MAVSYTKEMYKFEKVNETFKECIKDASYYYGYNNSFVKELCYLSNLYENIYDELVKKQKEDFDNILLDTKEANKATIDFMLLYANKIKNGEKKQ